jgi:hypothetical protein
MNMTSSSDNVESPELTIWNDEGGRAAMRFASPRRALMLCAVLPALACGSLEPPPVKEPWADIVKVESLAGNPTTYERRKVTVAGWARVEFEGNAIYPTKESMKRRTAQNAIWLQLGWPVSAAIRELDGAHIIVEGRFNSHHKGHFGRFAGALEDIRRIERSDSSRR